MIFANEMDSTTNRRELRVVGTAYSQDRYSIRIGTTIEKLGLSDVGLERYFYLQKNEQSDEVKLPLRFKVRNLERNLFVETRVSGKGIFRHYDARGFRYIAGIFQVEE